jgi:hypothetical protein
MELTEFLEKLNAYPTEISFAETMEVIKENYNYQPTAFTNGELQSAAATNEGSCKIFSFAKLHNLSEEKTLQLFGDYYRVDVLDNPQGTDHGNIRNFMKFGWKGIKFEGLALILK